MSGNGNQGQHPAMHNVADGAERQVGAVIVTAAVAAGIAAWKKLQDKRKSA